MTVSVWEMHKGQVKMRDTPCCSDVAADPTEIEAAAGLSALKYVIGVTELHDSARPPS